MFPKPTHKKKKALNNKAVMEPRCCAFCGKFTFAETHEVFGGNQRQESIRRGYQVALCMLCHREVTDNLPETIDRQNYWRASFQQKREQELMGEGMTSEQARTQWIKEMGKSYIHHVYGGDAEWK